MLRSNIMPSGGANKLPTVIKEMRGTSQKCRSNANEPRLVAADLQPAPQDLPADDQRIWERLREMINGMQVAAKCDAEFFRLTVRAVARADRTATDPNASVNQQIQADKAAADMLREWGLSPVSRSRVNQLGSKKTETTDPLAAFVAGAFTQPAPEDAV
jgi:hypothetical protein